MGYPKHVIFEGIDGTGKDTQIEMLALNLRTRGKEILYLRTPTGGKDGDLLKQVSTTKQGALLREQWRYASKLTESFFHKMTGPMFIADMYQLDMDMWLTGTNAMSVSPVETEFNLPRYMATPDPYFCIQSRSWASTYAYQHKEATTQALALEAGRNFKKPDLWIYLTQPIEVTMARINKRAGEGVREVQDMYEKEERLVATKKAYDELFNGTLWDNLVYGPVAYVQADAPAERVHADIMEILARHGVIDV